VTNFPYRYSVSLKKKVYQRREEKTPQPMKTSREHCNKGKVKVSLYNHRKKSTATTAFIAADEQMCAAMAVFSNTSLGYLTKKSSKHLRSSCIDTIKNLRSTNCT